MIRDNQPLQPNQPRTRFLARLSLAAVLGLPLLFFAMRLRIFAFVDDFTGFNAVGFALSWASLAVVAAGLCVSTLLLWGPASLRVDEYMAYLRTLALLALLFVAATTVNAAETEPATAQRYDPKIELPDGEGKALVLAACTRCHELKGLAAYKGYWGEPQWAAMVETMVKNGAVLTPVQIEAVAEYLARHFGKPM